MYRKVNCVVVMKAEVIWTVEGTVVAISQRWRHSTDENSYHLYKNDAGTR